MVSAVAREYGITPRQAAEEIDGDPDQLAIAIMPLRRYAEAYEAWRRGRKAELKEWADNPMMEQVKKNDFAEAEAELGLGQG
jgi:hypothetical protein